MSNSVPILPETAPFSEEQLVALLQLARKGIGELVELQKKVLL